MAGRGYDTTIQTLEYGGDMDITSRWIPAGGVFNSTGAPAGTSTTYIIYQPAFIAGKLTQAWFASVGGDTDTVFNIWKKDASDTKTIVATVTLSYTGGGFGGRELIDLTSDDIDVVAGDEFAIEYDAGTAPSQMRAVLCIED